MTDVDFTYLTGAVWVALIVAYAIRVSRFGKFRSDRVRGVGGGTVLVGENIMQATYWAIDPVVRGLVRIGATPNAVTFAALILGLGAGAAVAAGWFGLACLLATCSTMPLISSGSSRAICSVGSSLISSSEARSISRTSHALASSSRERSRRARGPRIGVMLWRSLDGPVGAGGFYELTPGNGGVDALSTIRAPLRRSPGWPT